MTDPLIVWGRNSSSNVQKVLWMLDELNLECERIGAETGFGEASKPEFLAVNPNGLVPILQHGDLTIWESQAILNYLAASFGTGKFWFDDPKQRAPIDQWAIWGNATFTPAIAAVFYAVVLTPPSQHDKTKIATALQNAATKIAILDERLAQSTFVAGDSLSIADMMTASFMYRWYTMEITRPSAPHVERWLDRLRERPGYRKWGEHSYEMLRRTD